MQTRTHTHAHLQTEGHTHTHLDSDKQSIVVSAYDSYVGFYIVKTH